MSADPSTASTACLDDLRALVAIDLGAESCRVSLLRFDSARQPHVELIHRFLNGAVQRADGLHWDMGTMLSQLQEGLRLCAARAPEGIRCLAVDGWAVDYVYLDAKTGKAADDPFCYRDPRTVGGEARLHERISAGRMRELTGIQLLPLNTAYQMAAESEQARQLRWLNVPEYVLYTLGARPVAERTNASHTQMLGLDGCWSQEIVAALDIPPASMPELVAPGTVIGQAGAPLSSLPEFAACQLIAPACHDTASAVAAIPDTADDWAYISSGTWSLVGTILTTANNTAAARAANFTNLAGVDDTVCFHKNVNGMWLLRQCLESWNERNNGAPLTVAPLVEAAAAFEQRNYVLDVDDPDLLGSGSMPQRINAQLRRRGLPEFNCDPYHAAELASFVFYSLAERYACVLRDIVSITGKPLSKLYIFGGGSQNELLNRRTAEATGLTVIRAGTECSTTGNFARQLATLEPVPGPRPTAQWATFVGVSEEEQRQARG